MIGRLISVSAGVGGRALFGLIFAITVIRQMPSEAAVLFFQTVLLQSVFINLVGGGGYVRGAAQSGSTAGSVRLLRGFLSSVILALAGVALLVTAFDMLNDLQAWQLTILVFSGTCTALNGHLMGIFSDVSGVRRLFVPLSVLFAALSGLLLVFPPRGFDAAIVIVAISQSAPLALLLMLNRRARGLMLCVVGCLQDKRTEPWWPFGNLVIGGAVAAYLLIFYSFRESWSTSVSPEVAAGAFFAFRLSETFIQVFSVLAAGASSLNRQLERITAFGWRKTSTAIAAVTALGALQMIVVSALQTALGISVTLLIFLAMQLACEPLRLGTALISVVELKSGRTSRFLVLSVVPAAMAAGFGLYTGLMSGPAGLFYYLTVLAMLQVTGWLLMAGAAQLGFSAESIKSR